VPQQRPRRLLPGWLPVGRHRHGGHRRSGKRSRPHGVLTSWGLPLTTSPPSHPRKTRPFFSFTYVEPSFHPFCFHIHAGTPFPDSFSRKIQRAGRARPRPYNDKFERKTKCTEFTP